MSIQHNLSSSSDEKYNKCNPFYCSSLCCSSEDSCANSTTDCQNSVCESSLCLNKCCVDGQCGTSDQCESTSIIGALLLSFLMGFLGLAFLVLCAWAIYRRLKHRYRISQLDMNNNVDRNPEIVQTDQVLLMEAQQQIKLEKIPLEEIVIGSLTTIGRFNSNPLFLTHNKTMNTDQQNTEHVKGLPLLSMILIDGQANTTEKFESLQGLESEISSSNAEESPKISQQSNLDEKMQSYVKKQFKNIIKRMQNQNNQEEQKCQQNEIDINLKQQKNLKYSSQNNSSKKQQEKSNVFKTYVERPQMQKIIHNLQQSTRLQSSFSLEQQTNSKSRFYHKNSKLIEQLKIQTDKIESSESSEKAYLSFSSQRSQSNLNLSK